ENVCERARVQPSAFALRWTSGSQWLAAEEIVSERAARRQKAASEPGPAKRPRRVKMEAPPGFELGMEVLQLHSRLQNRPRSATFLSNSRNPAAPSGMEFGLFVSGRLR